MTFHLTRAAVAKAALEAHAAGRLTAQHPILYHRQCVYRGEPDAEGKEYRCAVGWALPEEVLSDIKRFSIGDTSVEQLARTHGIVTFEEGVDWLQELHDTWAGKASDVEFPPGEVAEAEQSFLEALRDVPQ